MISQRTACVVRSLGISVIAVFTAFFVRYLLGPWLHDDAPFVLFYGAILFSAWYGGWPYGLFATALAASLTIHFFIAPIHEFHLYKQEEIIELALHAFTSSFGILLIEHLRHTQRRAREEAIVRKAAEEALRQSEAQLLEAQKRLRSHADELENRVLERTEALRRSLRFMEEFLYSMAHDLRAPVRAVKGLTEALVQDYAMHLDATAKDYGQRIDLACERMDRLITELLEYGRLFHTALELKPVGLQKLMESIIGEFENEIHTRNVRLKVSQFPQVALANDVALKQIFRNLLSNSIKFVPPGRQPEIRLWSEEQDDRVLLYVEDNGLGIPQEYLERIFKPFQRLHTQDEFPGVGMGLAIARLAAERMDATLSVISSPGVGSRFCLALKTAPKQKLPFFTLKPVAHLISQAQLH